MNVENAKYKIQNAKGLGLMLFFIFQFSFLIAPPAYAQIPAPLRSDLTEEIISLPQQAAQLGLGADLVGEVDLRLFIARLVSYGLTLVGVIFLGLLLYGGTLWMTSQGNAEKVETAKKWLFNTTVGLVLILTALAIARFVSTKIQRALFEQAVVQARSCANSQGQATCCAQWSRYQAEATSLRDQDAERSGARARRYHNEWQECIRRVRASIF